MTTNRFTGNWHTVYALSCGCYDNARDESENISMCLWSENGAYHVRIHDYNNNKRILWETFASVVVARAMFKKYEKEYKMHRVYNY